MNEKKQWVCHISGQGEKFFVEDQNERVWIIDEPCFIRLPKSEYRLCDPPEVWKDVTEAVCDGAFSACKPYVGFRLRKVQGSLEVAPNEWINNRWAFIIEQKVTG